MSATKPTIAFFGATGGTGAACLANTLKGGYTCRALVRSKAKLEKLLADRDVPSTVSSTHLTIIEGNVKDEAAVSQVLQVDQKRVVDIIISAVGGTPTFTPNPLKPGLDDPTICQDATNTIFAALRRLSSINKPSMVVVSTTGMSDAGRDIPIAMIPLYHWMLHVPHQDKKMMENLLVEQSVLPEAEKVLSGFVVVRASLLTSGKRLGSERVRVGIEYPRVKGSVSGEVPPVVPAIGYTISREDVGGWIYNKIIGNGGSGLGNEYRNKLVTVTY